MTTVLDRIVARTRTDLEARKAKVPLEALRERAVPTSRDFAGALAGEIPNPLVARPYRARQPGRTDRLSLIAEYKPKSPSRGPIRPDAQPEDIARIYERYASAISVLCDTPFFGGGYDLLARMRDTTTIPLLAKDFVVDDYQVYEARVHGGDAILLMVSVLAEPGLCRLLELARSLGMEPLVETHDDAELEVALRVGARVIGVNSRDLRTLAIDLPRARERLGRVPSECVRVAESGLEKPEDVEAIRPFANAALIGSSLMSAPDPAARIEELGWTSR